MNTTKSRIILALFWIFFLPFTLFSFTTPNTIVLDIVLFQNDAPIEGAKTVTISLIGDEDSDEGDTNLTFQTTGSAIAFSNGKASIPIAINDTSTLIQGKRFKDFKNVKIKLTIGDDFVEYLFIVK